MGGRRSAVIPELVPFGRHIAEVRMAAGLSQEDVAHRLGADQAYVSGIENGRRNPSATQLLKLAEGLGVTPAELFSYAGPDEITEDEAED